MRNSLRILLLSFFPVISFAQQGSFEIRGHITGLADHSTVVLTDADSPEDTVAQAFSQGSNFVLKGSLSESKLYSISFLPAEKKGALFLDNNKITVDGSIDKMQQLTVSGSPAHDGFVAFQKTFEPYFREFATLNETASKTGVTDSLKAAYKSVVKKLSIAGEGFAAKYKEQNIAPFMWSTIFQVIDSVDIVSKSYESMPSPVQNSFYGKYLGERLAGAKIGRVGSAALEFIQADTSGKPVSLSSFKGRYVLVDFWASWCGPCRQENPNVVAAFNRFREKNFTVLGVSLDKSRERWIKAIADDRLAWTQVSDLKYWQNEVALLYKIQSIPQNFLLDPNGVIVARNLRGEELNQKLCELLGCKE